MDNPISSLSSDIIWSCPWFTVREDTVVLPNGKKKKYWYAEKPNSVFIVPFTREKEVVLIRSYRYPMKEWFWEVPAGYQKKGKSPEESAHEELLEEIGGVSDRWQSIGQFCPNGGFIQSFTHIFLAMNVVLGKPKHEPEEQIEVHPTPIERVMEMVWNGEIASSQSALALFLCEERLKKINDGGIGASIQEVMQGLISKPLSGLD
ncbi:NUDIX hydrolase [Patescibacteria group bacterium]|nr:NUDIX hydrolase [Patescibacteria group bacterium]